MHRFIDGEDRRQQALLPHCLEDYVSEENPVRVIEVFIDELDLASLGFSGMTPAATGRPAYRPATLLKIYLYGYLNRIQSSRRLEREVQSMKAGRRTRCCRRSGAGICHTSPRSRSYTLPRARPFHPFGDPWHRPSLYHFHRVSFLETRRVALVVF